MSSQGLKYNVDLVFCIDVTGSMQPVINTVKANVLRFNGDLREALAQKGKNIDSLRIRIIAFRDFGADADNQDAPPLQMLDFVNIPEGESKVKSFIDGLSASGGGDEPENGLEAVALAIKSDWVKTGDKQRHIVVVWTDASAHPLGKFSNAPEGMPADFDVLTDWWNGQSMSATAKRMVLFAPDAAGWTDIATHWEQVVHLPSKAGEGLSDCDYKVILSTIANSI